MSKWEALSQWRRETWNKQPSPHWPMPHMTSLQTQRLSWSHPNGPRIWTSWRSPSKCQPNLWPHLQIASLLPAVTWLHGSRPPADLLMQNDAFPAEATGRCPRWICPCPREIREINSGRRVLQASFLPYPSVILLFVALWPPSFDIDYRYYKKNTCFSTVVINQLSVLGHVLVEFGMGRISARHHSGRSSTFSYPNFPWSGRPLSWRVPACRHLLVSHRDMIMWPNSSEYRPRSCIYRVYYY